MLIFLFSTNKIYIYAIYIHWIFQNMFLPVSMPRMINIPNASYNYFHFSFIYMSLFLCAHICMFSFLSFLMLWEHLGPILLANFKYSILKQSHIAMHLTSRTYSSCITETFLVKGYKVSLFTFILLNQPYRSTSKVSFLKKNALSKNYDYSKTSF